jgi:hypothetical protein
MKIPLLPPLSENRELLTAKAPHPEFHPPVGEIFSEKMEGESVPTLNEAPPFPPLTGANGTTGDT